MIPGTLYGVGVGPGDPELLTVKASRLISTARVIAYLAANGGESTARSIAASYLPEGVTEIVIDVPMRVDPQPAQAAYDHGASEIRTQLNAGQDVVMLCEGDPFFYGSFIFIFERLHEDFQTVVVPGVASFTASAAATNMPLSRRNDVVKIIPATLDIARVESELKTSDVAAIIKVGRHYQPIRALLLRLGLAASSTIVERATQHDQRIRPVAMTDDAILPYFSTILVRRESRSS